MFKNKHQNKKLETKIRTSMPIKNCVQTVMFIFYSTYHYYFIGWPSQFFSMLSPAEKINFPLILNGSVTYMHVLGFYVNEAILHLNKVKLIPKNFSKNSNLDDSDIYLPAFPSLTDLKLNNIPVTSELVKKFTFTLDSIKASVTDHIPVVVLKKCKPEFSWY